MARSFGKDVKNNFSKGVVSEFSGLNFPENAATDASNVVFSRTGIVTRRLGFDYEDNNEFFTVTRNHTEPVVQEYIWENVEGNGTLSFVVLQIGYNIYFYQISDSGALSANRKTFSINLKNYGIAQPANGLGQYPCQFAQGNGQLFIAHPKCDTLRVRYTGSANGNGTISVSEITLQIRDLEGVDDSFSVSKRPNKTEVNNLHKYNLFNQGWYSQVQVQDFSGRMTAIDAWRKKRDDFPNNADVWWLSKNANDKFDHSKIDGKVKGSTEAPKGHNIIYAFWQNRDTPDNLQTDIPVVTTYGERPSSIAFFAGRIFYGGVAHGQFHDKVYYSQIINDDRGYQKCFQAQDPTDENTAGLLPTDGGVITIPDIGRVIKMIPVQGYLLVFATNGVWTISGGTSSDFKATDYSVQKISDIQSLSASSYVLPKTGFPIWWNADGIFTCEIIPSDNQQRQRIEIRSLSDDTIRSLYSDIPANSKKYAKGAYNPLENVIQWVYWSEDPDTNRVNLYHYDSILILDLDTGAFNFWHFPIVNTLPLISGVISTRGSGVDFQEVTITDDADEDVVDASGDDVTVLDSVVVPLSSSFRYTTIELVTSPNTWRVTFAQELNDEFYDWVSYDTVGTDYESFFDTGYEIRGEGQRPFQSNIVNVYSNAQEGSSCFLQGIWDYSVDDASGRETSAHQVYIDRSFVGVQRRKIRLRGRGYALQLRFFSEEGKPFNILGWSSFQSANNVP